MATKTQTEEKHTARATTKPTPGPEDVAKNLDLAAKVFNANLDQQNEVAHRQAMAHLRLAAVGKCAELILAIDPHDPNAGDLLRQYRELLDLFDEKLR